MKKLLFILLSVVLYFGAIAQNGTVDRVMKTNDILYKYVGEADDTVGIADSVWTYTVAKVPVSKSYCNIFMDVDTVTGTSDTIYFYLQYKPSPDGDYINTDTVTYYQTADTTFNFANSTSVQGYYWRLRMVGNKDEAKAEVQKLNFTISY